MRRVAAFGLVALLGALGASPPVPARAALAVRGVPLEKALEALASRTGLRYAVSEEVLRTARPVTYEGEAEVAAILADIATQAGVEWGMTREGAAVFRAVPAPPAGAALPAPAPLRLAPRHAVTALAFSRAGDRLAAGCTDSAPLATGQMRVGNPIRVFELPSGREALAFAAHDGGVGSIAFSGDGRRIASGGMDRRLRVWDAATGEAVEDVPMGWGPEVAFLPDGRTLAASGAVRNGDGVGLFEFREKDPLPSAVFPIPGRINRITALAVSPDGGTIACAFSDVRPDGAGHEILLLDARDGRTIHRLRGLGGPFLSLSFSPDGARLAFGTGLMNVLRGTPEAADPAGPPGPEIREFGDPADSAVRLLDVREGREVARFEGLKGFLAAVAFSPDGRVLASASGDGSVHLWDPKAGRRFRTLEGHPGGCTAVAFSPDGRHLASAGLDARVLVWRLEPPGNP